MAEETKKLNILCLHGLSNKLQVALATRVVVRVIPTLAPRYMYGLLTYVLKALTKTDLFLEVKDFGIRERR
uniref:Uncharacterized protein n=1 Tax=Romanomermis culicivorax TaxID=13658 RepID=A0A915JI89_ROMCU